MTGPALGSVTEMLRAVLVPTFLTVIVQWIRSPASVCPSPLVSIAVPVTVTVNAVGPDTAVLLVDGAEVTTMGWQSILAWIMWAIPGPKTGHGAKAVAVAVLVTNPAAASDDVTVWGWSAVHVTDSPGANLSRGQVTLPPKGSVTAGVARVRLPALVSVNVHEMVSPTSVVPLEFVSAVWTVVASDSPGASVADTRENDGSEFDLFSLGRAARYC